MLHINKSQLHFRFFFFIIVFTCVISSFSQERDNYSLLWKIESKKSLKPSYIFGTMHVNDAKAFQFSDAVLPSIKNTEIFALEVEPDSMLTVLNKEMKRSLNLDVFKKVLSDEEFNKLKLRFEEINGYPIEEVQIGSPDFILQSLVPNKEKKDDKSTFVDAYLYSLALTMQKKIIGLELIKDHMQLYNKMSDKDKYDYIMEYISNDIDDYDKHLEELKQVYYAGDLNKIKDILITQKSLNDSTLVRRNKYMTNSIASVINKNKSIFSAVGAAHLPGDNGILNLLKKKGFKVSPVEAKFTGKKNEFKVDYLKMKWIDYKNSDLGYSISLPSKPNDSTDFELFKTYSYKGLINEDVLSFLVLDLRKVPKTNDSLSIIDRFIETSVKNIDGTIKKIETIEIENGEQRNLVISLNEEDLVKAHIVIKNDILFYLFASVKEKSQNNGYSDRFLNSLTIGVPKPIEEPDSEWINYINNEGAYSINLPSKPIDKSRTTPNPLEPDGEPYYMKMIMSMDVKNENNYLFRYNDMPLGFYMQDTVEGYESMKSALGSTAEFVSDLKVIHQQGYEGREFEILIQGKYHSVCRMFYRGNRTYLLLKQKLNQSDKASTEDAFFNSFKFIDHQQETLKYYKPEGENFEFLTHSKIKRQDDNSVDDYSYAKSSTDIFHTNNRNGDLYQFSYINLKDYFKIKDLSEFYDINIEALREWNDTITKQSEVTISGAKGITFNKKNKKTSLESRHQIWLKNKRMYFISAYPEEVRLNSKQTDSIFNSFVFTNDDEFFDVYSSKLDLIIANLQASDTLVRNSALGTFDYYEFDSNEMIKLKTLLYKKNSNSDFDLTLKQKILQEYYNINDSTSIDELKTYYLKPDTDEMLKKDILTLISDLEYANALPTYLELLKNNPPKNNADYNYKLLGPIKDSLNLAYNNLNTLLKLNRTRNYRRDALDIYKRILENDNLDHQPIYENLETILKFAKEDVDAFINYINNKNAEYNYVHTVLMYNYLYLFENLNVTKPIIDYLTKSILNTEEKENKWIHLLAFITRLKHDLKVEEGSIKKKTNDLFSRLEIIKFHHKTKRLKEIPKSFLSPESFAKLSFYNYISDDNQYPDHIEVLDSFKHNEKTFYAFTFWYDSDDNEITEKFIGIVGDIKQITEDAEFKRYKCYTNWDIKEDNWKDQTIKMIDNYEEYGY